jgi:drug/metabolite transporter (DMT)-like permease
VRNIWWLPGALLALAGLLFLGAAADAERPGVWLAIGAAFLAMGVSYVIWRRPRAEKIQ